MSDSTLPITTQLSTNPDFQPYVPPNVKLSELTTKSILIGLFFACLFGASSAFLGLRTGLTIGSSIPIAVIGIGVLKRLGKITILENNIIQALGSTGGSLVSSIVFRTTGLLFLAGGANYFHYPQLLILALLGGVLGVLLMIPLRRSLIVKEHETLPYPEGSACAEVLIAGEKEGPLVKPVFVGFFVGGIYWIGMKLFGLWNEVPYLLHRGAQVFYPNATLMIDVAPEYLGIGYIIGPRASSQMMFGGLLNWLVLIPLFSALPQLVHWLGVSDVYSTLSGLGIPVENTQIPPSAAQVHNAFGKFVAVGGVVFAGLITLGRSFPIIIASFRSAVDSLRERKIRIHLRTERDIPMWVVVAGIASVIILIPLLPQMPGKFPVSLLMSLLIAVFGFFFVTVSSRLVGVIGYSMEPIGPMMFTTVIATCLIFIVLRLTHTEDQIIVLIVGIVVCTAAEIAGATSQDLKTGFLLGATPWKLQAAIIVGVLFSAVVMAAVVLLIDHSIPNVPHAIGYIAPGEDTATFAAPPANIIATLIKAVLTGKVPWGLVALGALLALIAELSGMGALSFAVGIYLPLSVTMAIFFGAVIRSLVNRKEKQAARLNAAGGSEFSPGMLYSTGLVAGGSIIGMLLGFFSGFLPKQALLLDVGQEYWKHMEPWGDFGAVLIFLLLGILLYQRARAKKAAHKL